MNLLKALSAAADATSTNQTNRLPQRPDPRLMSRDDYASSIPWYSRLVGEMVGQPHDLPNDNMVRIEGPDGNFFTGEMMRAEIPDAPGDLRNMIRALGRMPERTNPAYVASKKWYHGTATEGLSPQRIDATGTNPSSLYGPGFYMTDDSFEVPQGYARARANKWSGTPFEDAGKKSAGREIIYEGRVEPKKVLDLEEPAPEEVQGVFRNLTEPQGDVRSLDFDPYVAVEDPYNLNKALQKKDATTSELFDALRADMHGLPMDEWEGVMEQVGFNLNKAGYDAMTHTGGLRTGGKEHQVMILLDPSNSTGFFDENPIKSLKEVRKPTKNTPRKTEWPMFRR